ncbi:MAG TPA: PIN domain-containing protein [Thermoanaerobaculia bacterium]|nr:PIN domain-containing protein [Thermoanaerobaculia bacterium]
MTLRYLLDTSTLSAAISAKPNRIVLRRLTQRGPQCAIAAIVWNELIYGFQRLEAGKRKTELDAYLQDVVLKSFPILPYDEAAATWHGASSPGTTGPIWPIRTVKSPPSHVFTT